MTRFFFIRDLKSRPQDEQELAWHATKGYGWRHWQVWVACLLGLLGAGVPVYFALGAVLPSITVPYREFKFFAVGAIGGGFITVVTRFVMHLATAYVVRGRAQEYLRALAGSDPNDLDPTPDSSKSDAE